jgi:two-component system, NarL family, sensor histidine kinase UhpB
LFAFAAALAVAMQTAMRSWFSSGSMLIASLVMSAVVVMPTAASAQAAPNAPATSLTIDRAVVTEGTVESTRYPQSPAAQREVDLPDDWSSTRPKEHTPAWYRIDFDLPAPMRDQALALYIERACSNALVILNGHVLHREGDHARPSARRCRIPIHTAIGDTVLRPRGNRLEIKVVGYPIQQVGSDERSAWLSTIEFGPAAALAAKAARQTLLLRELPQVTAFALLAMAAALAILGMMDRRNRHIVYFAGILVTYGLFCVRHWWMETPLSNYGVELVSVALLPWLAMASIQFFLQYAGWRSQPIEVALLAQCLIVPASLMLGGSWRVHTLTSSWLVLLAIEIFVAMSIYLWTMWHRNRRQFVYMSVFCGLSAVFFVMLIMLQQDRAAPVSGTLAQHGIGLLLFVMSLRLAWEYGRELQLSEASRHSTEARVREATLEIERNFTQLAELRVEQVTAQERKRIAGDLHDDLGAKLLTIVHTSDNDRIATLAREALEEMRLSVRGLTGRPVKLVDALGDWRAEFVSRLSQTGLEADWESPNDDELTQTLSARTYVQTTRILREAVNNIIKHSQASRCSVTAGLAGGDFQLAIQDNGKGISSEDDKRLDRGHGMASMKHRAKQLHGQCLVESGPGLGTVIRLTLPLDRQVEPA